VTFRNLLVSEFDRRRTANPRYSLRSFARDLSIDHSTLSQIVRGRRRLTHRTVVALGRKLRLPAEALAEFCALENEAAVRRHCGKRTTSPTAFTRPRSAWV
jgi:plasmid maintenance system antidote protein VapI